MDHHLISLTVFLPLLGALLQALFPSAPRSGVARWIALGTSILAGICGIVVVFSMRTEFADLQLAESLPWVGSYAIGYEMGVDGLNALLVLLVAIVFPVLIASEWDQGLCPRGMHGLFLVLQAAFFGVVCAQDLFLQFFFWALCAVPFYFLIGIWGGEDREEAAFRSMVAASIGNALLFCALLLIYYTLEPHTFSLRDLVGGKLSGKTFEFLGQTVSVSSASVVLISGGLALRTPIWPLHGWFTRVAKEAPPAVLVLFMAVAAPVGSYLFLRLLFSLFPEAVQKVAPYILVIGTINLLIGVVCAITQKGLRTMIAYLGLSQTGIVLIGLGSLSSAGVVGAVYQQMSLGLALAGFGLLAGLISSRAGHSLFLGAEGKSLFGGVVLKAPTAAVIAGILLASILGFPGMGGFVGTSLVIIGSYSVQPFVVILSCLALILGGHGLFAMYRHIFLGPVGQGTEAFQELSLRERAYLLPLVSGLLVFGIYPKPLLDLVRPTVLTLLSTIK